MLLQLQEKLPKNSTSLILWQFGIWSKLGSWKNFSGCLMSWPQIKIIIILKGRLLLFWATITNHFLIGLWRATKSGCYMTTSNDQLSGWTEKKLQSTSQNQTCTKKRVIVTVSALLLVWSATAFWILGKPLHLRGTLNKLMRCIENCNAWSWHWSTERAQFFSMTTLDHISHNQCFKSWMNWTMKFCLICHSYLTTHQLTIMSSGILTTFCGKMLPQPAGGRKCFPRARQIQKHGFLPYRNKQTYFLLAKMCWL